MKFLFQNTSKISIALIGIFFVVTLGWIFLKDIFLHFIFQEFHNSSSIQGQSHWEILHTKNANVIGSIDCDVSYPVFFSWSLQRNSGNELFSGVIQQGQDNTMIQECEWQISRPIFQNSWWWYSSGTLTLILSWWLRSTFDIDRAFDTNGHLFPNDHAFRINTSTLIQDLSPYFGKNIAHTLSSKIEQMTLQGRVIAPNEHERVLFFRKPPTISWPSDWMEIQFIWSKDDWHIVLPPNLIKRYKIESALIHPRLQDKVLSLTFDDGPSKEYTPIILDILKSHHIRATFCILWSQAVKYPELVRRIYEEWHEICNHSVTHSSFVSAGIVQAQDEIIRNEQIIRDVLGMSIIIPFVRPPYGAISVDMERELNTPFALWSVDTLDWKDNRPKSIMKRASVARSSDIVLFHDIHPGVTKMLDEYISKYTSDGYAFTTLSQMVESWSLSDISGQSLFRLNKVKYLHSEE
jgi:peptidoglycan/xylan/chitin deacetylase (PgdA/CDA1 family)